MWKDGLVSQEAWPDAHTGGGDRHLRACEGSVGTKTLLIQTESWDSKSNTHSQIKRN